MSEWFPEFYREAARQARETSTEWPGRQRCCGATNPHCARPPGVVFMRNTGCDTCGHPLGCHVWPDR